MTGEKMIDLRSDTVTKPTAAMREAMAAAEVGDDQYGEDPTVNELEARAAELLGKDAAVFVASGTMGNLTAVLAHCLRGDEVILGDEAHILWYESAGPATVGGVSPRTIRNQPDATFDLDELQAAIRENRDGFPPTGLICVENTHNRCGGAVLPLAHLRDVREIADRHGLPVHMDGARIFNAAAALGVSAAEIASHVDSVQFCLSKGLAAPVGSLVAGSAEFITRVRRYRKLVGGAMRQSGVIAAAGLVAFETMIDRLPEDHRRAREIAGAIADLPGFELDLDRVQTNIVVFKPAASIDKGAYMDALRQEGVLVSDYGLRGLRIVTHYEITDEDVATAIDALGRATEAMTGERQRAIA